jgi:hypothetical protein
MTRKKKLDSEAKPHMALQLTVERAFDTLKENFHGHPCATTDEEGKGEGP